MVILPALSIQLHFVSLQPMTIAFCPLTVHPESASMLVTTQQVMASTKGGSSLIPGKISPLKEWLNLGKATQGRGLKSVKKKMSRCGTLWHALAGMVVFWTWPWRSFSTLKILWFILSPALLVSDISKKLSLSFLFLQVKQTQPIQTLPVFPLPGHPCGCLLCWLTTLAYWRGLQSIPGEGWCSPVCS